MTEPSCGIDTRCKNKADDRSGELFAILSRLTQQHGKSDIARLCHAAQPSRHNDAVFPAQRHDIRHRAQGHQIGILFQNRSLLFRSSDRTGELKRNPYTGKLRERILAIHSLGVNDRIGIRQFLPTLMMVGYDYIHAKHAGMCNFFKCRYARIHCNNELCALSCKSIHCGNTEPIAFTQAVWDVVPYICAHCPQHTGHDTSRRNTIHIIVPKNYNAFSLCYRIL